MTHPLSHSSVALRPAFDDRWILAGLSARDAAPLPRQERASAVLATVVGQRGMRRHLCISAAEGVPALEWFRHEVKALTQAGHLRDGPIVSSALADLPALCGEFVAADDGQPRFSPGALTAAGSGWLVLEATALLAEGNAVSHLERCLASRQVLWRPAPGVTPAWISPPAAVALDAQVVLLAQPADLDELQAHFPALMKWFGTLVTLENTCPLDDQHVPLLVACLEQQRSTRGLDALSLASWHSLLQWGCRTIEQSQRLSLATEHYLDVLMEAQHCRDKVAPGAEEDPVAGALAVRRLGIQALEDSIQREVIQGVSLAGLGPACVGAVTALTLVSHHTHSLMIPARISATARQGDGKVIDIERESELGGSSHTKGVMILSAWLGHALGAARPLSLSAHIACEQCHDPIEGDSASAAELAALVSAIAQVPMAQHVAVTGAVSQHGDIMAVGGINDKIEGHFRLMKAAGRLPEATALPPSVEIPGIIIPSGNGPHLCLDADVIHAVAEGCYRIMPVSRVEQMLALLSGLPWEADTAAADSLRQKALSRLDSFERTHRDDSGRSHWPRPLREK